MRKEVKRETPQAKQEKRSRRVVPIGELAWKVLADVQRKQQPRLF